MSDSTFPDVPDAVVPTQALWTWSTTPGQQPVVQSYPTVPGCPTKSGVTVQDLRNYMQFPLNQGGNPPIPISNDVIQGWIRYAEDEIEQDTNIRLCQTWIASPPAKTLYQKQAINVGTKYNYQQLGVDYDYADAAYDFFLQPCDR